MRSRPQFTDLTYMGSTGPCGPMRITFGSVIRSWYTSLNIKFDANRTFYEPKTPVYRFDLYGRYWFSIPTGLWLKISLFAKFQVCSSLRLDVIVITTYRRTDRHSSNGLEFRADQMAPRNLGS